MKILSAIIALCFTLNVFASSGTLKELERAIDDYQYAMTVEWDQKDKAFQEKETKAFMDRMEKLHKEGLTSEDVNFLVENRIKNQKILEAIKVKTALLGNKTSPAELAEILKNSTTDLYHSGASWNGDAQLWVIGGVVVAIIAIAVAYSSWQSKNYVCTKYAEADQCVDEYDCRGESCFYDGTYCGIITRCIKEERVGLE